MTLDSETMATIAADFLLRPGRPPTIKGPEADLFRSALRRDVERLRRDGGGVLEFPGTGFEFRVEGE